MAEATLDKQNIYCVLAALHAVSLLTGRNDPYKRTRSSEKNLAKLVQPLIPLPRKRLTCISYVLHLVQIPREISTPSCGTAKLKEFKLRTSLWSIINNDNDSSLSITDQSS